MATTFLTLTNDVLRELNEIELTTATFANAKGIQNFVKNSINKSINDIATEEPQLPFFAVGASGGTDPFYGNVTVATVAGTRWYTTTINVSGESSPYVSKGLRYISLDEWTRYFRDSENQDDADSQNFGEPQYVVRSPDHRKFGVSPIPDKVYNIHFYAYTIPTSLSAYSDAIVLPDQYSNVITAKARYYVWQFKESPQQAAFALEDYKKGMRQMKSNLMNPAPTYITDDRIYF